MSAVELDGPPGLISGSPIFLFFFFQTDITLLHNFFLISRCLEFSCITFVHHFFFNSCSALHVLPNYDTTWASCSPYLSKMFCRKYNFFAGLPFANSSFCWSCRTPWTANTQIQELQIPSTITFKTSHWTCCRQQQDFIGAVRLAHQNSSHPPHVQFGSIL